MEGKIIAVKAQRLPKITFKNQRGISHGSQQQKNSVNGPSKFPALRGIKPNEDCHVKKERDAIAGFCQVLLLSQNKTGGRIGSQEKERIKRHRHDDFEFSLTDKIKGQPCPGDEKKKQI